MDIRTVFGSKTFNDDVMRADPLREIIYAKYLPLLENENPERATVPSVDRVFGSKNTLGSASNDSWTYITA